MKFGDFSSVVQLGVELHVGTALLQLYGELGLQPLVRTIARIKNLLEYVTDNDDLESEFTDIEGEFNVFRINMFNRYKILIAANGAVAALLAGWLILIAYMSDAQVSTTLSVIIVALSLVPAPLTLGAFWYQSSWQTSTLRRRARELEAKLIAGFARG
jgi:hypothetical protein